MQEKWNVSRKVASFQSCIYAVLDRLQAIIRCCGTIMLFLFGSESLNLADLSRSASHLIIIWLRVHRLIEPGGREDFGVGMLPYCVQYLRRPLHEQKSKIKILIDRWGQIYAIHKDCLRWETVLLGDRNLAWFSRNITKVVGVKYFLKYLPYSVPM